MPDIKLTQLVKRFNKGDRPAVNHVSFTVEDGSFTCILGPSGCGKSTLLRMISGLEQASDGEISIGGSVVDAPTTGQYIPPEKRGVGLVFQSYALWPHMTVADNIAFGLKLQKLNATERKTRVAEMVAMLRIEGLEHRYPAQLSGGQQQRVALARTLALNPKVLLLDEPLSNLDASLRLQMRTELARLHREFGTTIVFVTHDQWEAMTLATHIAVVSEGQLQQIGTANEIYDTPANRFVAEFIGNPPINVFEAGSKVADLLTPAPVTGQGALSVALRPEAIELWTPDCMEGLPVRVSAVIPTGGAWIIELVLDGADAPVLAATHKRPDFGPGAPLRAWAPAEALHFFDASGTRVPPAPANRASGTPVARHPELTSAT